MNEEAIHFDLTTGRPSDDAKKKQSSQWLVRQWSIRLAEATRQGSFLGRVLI